MKKMPEPDMAMKLMFFIHDNALRRLMENPYKMLKNAGVEEGKKVLEIGCGTGYFTIPAAQIVGENGRVYALDIHPLSIEKVRDKIKKFGVGNVIPVLSPAHDTGIEDECVDVAFLFGVVHKIDEYFYEVMEEMRRVIKKGGILSIKKSSLWKKKLKYALEGMFDYVGYKEGVHIFRKI